MSRRVGLRLGDEWRGRADERLFAKSSESGQTVQKAGRKAKTYEKLSFRSSSSGSEAAGLPPRCSRNSLSLLPSPAATAASPGSSADLRAQDQGEPLIRVGSSLRALSGATVALRVNKREGDSEASRPVLERTLCEE